MTSLTGWDRGTRTVVVGIAGTLKAHAARSQKQAQEALRYLARATLNLFGRRRQYPETSRDILFSTAMALRLVGEDRRAAQIQEIAERVRDGTSWIYPYQAAGILPRTAP